jgi:hypothetical protein
VDSRALRLRWYLVIPVLAALCPLLAFSPFVVYQNGLAYRTTAEQDLLKTAREERLEDPGAKLGRDPGARR